MREWNFLGDPLLRNWPLQLERFFTGLESQWASAGKPVQNDKAQYLWGLSGPLGNGFTQNDKRTVSRVYYLI
jgi:hypothetical protein